MGNIYLLDCTLRDGGYVNDWRFGEDTIRQSTDGTVTRGSLCSGFQADFFTSDGARLADAQVVDVDLSGCDSIVFWYHWNTRQARYIGETRIYGISKQP